MADPVTLALEAKRVLESEAYKQAFNAMTDLLESRALGCDPDNKEQTQRVILAKQILAGIQREFERMIANGSFEELKLVELEKRVFKR